MRDRGNEGRFHALHASDLGYVIEDRDHALNARLILAAHHRRLRLIHTAVLFPHHDLHSALLALFEGGVEQIAHLAPSISAAAGLSKRTTPDLLTTMTPT